MDEHAEEPLFELNTEQQDLLNAALVPFRLVGQLGDGTKWPVWDYVARTYSRPGEHAQRAEEVLASLPTGISVRPDQASARLYWTEPRRSDGTVTDYDLFGLKIAGMYALRSYDSLIGKLADSLAEYIGGLARAAEELPPSPFEVANLDAPLIDITAKIFDRDKCELLTLKREAVTTVLEHESVVLNVTSDAMSTTCRISGRELHQFVNVYTAEYYLTIAWKTPLVSSESSWKSPLTLIATIDYFGYVLEKTSGWPTGINLVRPHSLTAAASLGMDAQTSEEYESRISGLCTVIDQFGLPENGQGASINRLRDYLRDLIGEEPYRSNMEEAVKTLRRVRAIRVAQQHDSNKNKNDAIKSRRELDLPDYPASWNDDWNLIRERVAGALMQIIVSIQGSTSND